MLSHAMCCATLCCAVLCCAVSGQVHELVGCVVEHRGTDEDDMSGVDKVIQRLFSLIIMRMEGLEPDMEL